MIDFLTAIENWVEQGKAPDSMVGVHKNSGGAIAFSRPVYPFPLYARYAGRGDPNDATSFRPVAP